MGEQVRSCQNPQGSPAGREEVAVPSPSTPETPSTKPSLGNSCWSSRPEIPGGIQADAAERESDQGSPPPPLPGAQCCYP